MTETQTPPPPVSAPLPEGEPKTFDEDYVKGLRDEAAQHRLAKKEADEKAQAANQRLLEARVEVLGSDLADTADFFAWVPTDGLFGEDGFPSDEAIQAAISELLTRKPHLRTREARGDIDQGGRGENVETFSFNDWLRNAGS